MSNTEWTLEKALAAKGLPFHTERQESSLGLFHLLGELKSIKRAGWIRHGIADCESIAAHSFRMTAMVDQLPDTIDKYRCMKLCLYHDLAESIVGDYTPLDRIPKEEKYRREREAIEYITQTQVKDEKTGSEILSCWLEFEDGETAESKYANDIDKVDMITQMFEYEKREQGRVNLQEFTRAGNFMKMPETKAWIAELLERREEFWASAGSNKAELVEDETTKKLVDQYYGS
ncbi:HD domain-containing protein [Mariannaea sp. PMI_226]|nr:HD domain-containing protein [Mariannaea sp. PMI_226]